MKETTPLADDLDEVSEALSSQTPLFRELVVQRSRAYVKRSQKIETEDAAVFPQREPPKVAQYNIRELRRRA